MARRATIQLKVHRQIVQSNPLGEIQEAAAKLWIMPGTSGRQPRRSRATMAASTSGS